MQFIALRSIGKFMTIQLPYCGLYHPDYCNLPVFMEVKWTEAQGYRLIGAPWREIYALLVSWEEYDPQDDPYVTGIAKCVQTMFGTPIHEPVGQVLALQGLT
jgi:hypothetical protein